MHCRRPIGIRQMTLRKRQFFANLMIFFETVSKKFRLIRLFMIFCLYVFFLSVKMIAILGNGKFQAVIPYRPILRNSSPLSIHREPPSGMSG